jgi:hypothetical protein
MNIRKASWPRKSLKQFVEKNIYGFKLYASISVWRIPGHNEVNPYTERPRSVLDFKKLFQRFCVEEKAVPLIGCSKGISKRSASIIINLFISGYIF